MAVRMRDVVVTLCEACYPGNPEKQRQMIDALRMPPGADDFVQEASIEALRDYYEETGAWPEITPALQNAFLVLAKYLELRQVTLEVATSGPAGSLDF